MAYGSLKENGPHGDSMLKVLGSPAGGIAREGLALEELNH